jgi:outer membrane protein OmpA-like peptidoglycan-associated protein
MVLLLTTTVLASVPHSAAHFQAGFRHGHLEIQSSISSTAHAEILQRTALSVVVAGQPELRFEEPAPMPAGWALITEQTVRALAATDHADATISATEVRVKGVSSNAGAWEQASHGIRRALLPDMQYIDEVETVAPQVSFATLCMRQFNSALREGGVHFPLSRAALGPGSQSLLDTLIEIASDCPTAHIVVSGHTDASGDEVANRDVSTQRAQAGVEYMAAHGIDATRLTGRRAAAMPAA